MAETASQPFGVKSVPDYRVHLVWHSIRSWFTFEYFRRSLTHTWDREWRYKHNHQIREQYYNYDITAHIKSRRLRWAVNISRSKGTKNKECEDQKEEEWLIDWGEDDGVAPRLASQNIGL